MFFNFPKFGGPCKFTRSFAEKKTHFNQIFGEGVIVFVMFSIKILKIIIRLNFVKQYNFSLKHVSFSQYIHMMILQLSFFRCHRGEEPASRGLEFLVLLLNYFLSMG